MLVGIFEILILKVYQSQWIPPIPIDPDVDILYFGEFFLFLLEYTVVICSQC